MHGPILISKCCSFNGRKFPAYGSVGEFVVEKLGTETGLTPIMHVFPCQYQSSDMAF